MILMSLIWCASMNDSSLGGLFVEALNRLLQPLPTQKDRNQIPNQKEGNAKTKSSNSPPINTPWESYSSPLAPTNE